MHISEGILSPEILAAGAVVTLIGVGLGLRKISEQDIPVTALMTAFFFVASLIHIPIGPASGHLVLNGLLGIILGLKAWPAIFVGLALQAVLFQFGGLTTLGVNTCIIALPGAMFGILARHLMQKVDKKFRPLIAAFASGAAVIGSSFLAAILLYMTGEGFATPAKLLLLSYLPIALIEGIVTLFLISFVMKVKPELLFRAVVAGFILFASYTMFAGPAYAHRINIFAWEEGNKIVGEGYFASGRKCKGCQVSLYNIDGNLLSQTVTDDNGQFSFKVANQGGSYRLVLNGGLGHRAETVFKVDIDNVKAVKAEVSPSAEKGSNSNTQCVISFSQKEFGTLLDNKLRPLIKEVRELRKHQQKVDFKDVVAGIGYIFGLMGLALFVLGRKK